MLKNNFTENMCHILQNPTILDIKIREIRSMLISELKNDNFLLDCLECLLTSLSESSSSSWNNPPIYYDPELQISIRIIFWPEQYSNNPHKHKTWSITGVLFNSISIQTFAWANQIENSTLLVEKNINAGKGEVGFLMPECIHSLANETENISATIHISNEAGINREDNAIWYPSPKKGEILKGARERTLKICLKILSDIKNDRSIQLINRIFDLSENKLKLEVVKHILKIDPLMALQKSRELENLIPKNSQDYQNILKINNQLEKNIKRDL